MVSFEIRSRSLEHLNCLDVVQQVDIYCNLPPALSKYLHDNLATAGAFCENFAFCIAPPFCQFNVLVKFGPNFMGFLERQSHEIFITS